MTEKKMDFDPKNVKTINTESKISYTFLAQQCLCCENTREVPYGFSGYNQFVCDECREAIAFLKDFMKSCDKAKELLNEMEESYENSI